MQITKAEVIPIELPLRKPVRAASVPEINHVTAIFVRLETRQGQSAWGCTVAQKDLTDEKPENVIRKCNECASLVPDLNPLNIEFSIAQLACLSKAPPTVLCAFDLAFHDLLGLAAGMPVYRILGGFRNRIQTSITIPLASLDESVEMAREYAALGFRMLKIKGGANPEEDIRRVQAIHQALPHHVLRLDADGGYSVQEALEVSRTLGNILEMLEQPTPANDLIALRQVKEYSPVPVLADQSVTDPSSALDLAAHQIVSGLSVKLVACGGLRNGRQMDAIARAAHLTTMVSCYIEPALLIAAGLSLALSSSNVRYGDLDGYLSLASDPSEGGFHLEDGWLIASDTPGLGSIVSIG